METQSQTQTPSQAISISLVEAVKYAKLVDLADIVYKVAVQNNDTASQQNPSILAYRTILRSKTYQLLVDTNFDLEYKLLYNIQMTENGSPVYFGFIAQNKSSKDYVIVFRGTETISELGSDDLIYPTTFNEFNNNAQVPVGFYTLYGAGSITSLPHDTQLSASLSAVAANPVKFMPDAMSVQTVVAGHSLGSTIATYYAAAVTAGQDKDIDLSLYTFASPMTGDKTFTDTFNSNMGRSHRVYNVPDNVPNLPIWLDNNGNNIYTQVARGYKVDSTNDTNVTPGAGCAHQLPVYQYLLEKLNGNTNPNILNAGFCSCKS
ncbi:MAG: lipase family protein [Chitinophaga sp.]|uniref:lipase family protein n=1 Tax=Chitinophaga sp. TaxID=1869181 RepID=UPI001B0CD03A|nr:lipase family protein [Chitinophaga sp.]MBO9729402.1 lipase family protein [Chitinophaga sp.]